MADDKEEHKQVVDLDKPRQYPNKIYFLCMVNQVLKIKYKTCLTREVINWLLSYGPEEMFNIQMGVLVGVCKYANWRDEFPVNHRVFADSLACYKDPTNYSDNRNFIERLLTRRSIK